MESFDILKKFSQTFRHNRLAKDIPFSLSDPPRSKVERLFQGIINGEFKNDYDASEYFYKTSPSNPAYHKLKERLHKRLIQHLFLIDFEDKKFAGESKKYYEGLTLVIASKILMGIDQNFVASAIIKKGIKIAIDYKHSEIGLLLAASHQFFLKSYSQSGRKKKGEKLLETPLSFFSKNLLLEIEIDNLYGQIIDNLFKGAMPNKKVVIESYIKLKSFQDQNKSIKNAAIVRMYYALAAAEIYMKKFREAIITCNQGLDELKGSQVISKHIISLLKAQCYLHLNDFDKTKESIEEAAELRKIRPGISWAGFLELEFIKSARSLSFESLPEIFIKATTNSNLRSRPNAAQESWHQYGLLLLFLIQLDKIPPSESLNKVKPKLRLGKLLNELQEYAKDKSGQNLSIRILHAMILLVSKRYDEFEESLPPLQAYIQRYIRKYPELARSGMLVKMLSHIPAVGYDAERAAWRARTQLEKMTVPPETLPLKITEMEVIPYEKMWQFVVEFLHTIKKRPSAKKRDT